MSECPICAAKLMVIEDWPGGRVTLCEASDTPHYKKVERFDKCPSAELLDQYEIEEERRNHAA